MEKKLFKLLKRAGFPVCCMEEGNVKERVKEEAFETVEQNGASMDVFRFIYAE